MVVQPASRTVTQSQPSDGLSLLDKAISLMSALTMLSTVPQALQVWLGSASGVSLVSWGAYLVAACLWLITGCESTTNRSTLPASAGLSWTPQSSSALSSGNEQD